MRRILILVLFLGFFFVPLVNAAFPPNPHNCCIYCPYDGQELCFWNDETFLYMSIDPDSIGSICGHLHITIIQDDRQYDDLYMFDEFNENVCGDIYIYREVKIVDLFTRLSPFDPTRPMTIVNKNCDGSFEDPAFLEYPCATTTTTIITSTTSTPEPSTTTTTPGPTTTTTISEDCFTEEIYGEDSEEAILLRYFRDSVLSQTSEGQEIIRLYYQWSPAIVRAMEANGEFKEDVKEMIDGVLELIEGEVE